tara:strand:- start:85 stop:513 length:429 start_codon:yes stop_codon:yes gene_type:complete
MDTFNLRKFLKEGKLLKEYFDNDIENYISIIGYDTYDQFFEDNPGAVNAMEEFIFTVPEFRKQLIMQGYEDVARMYEGKINKLKEDRFEDVEYIFSGEEEDYEAPAHITALAIAAEDAYEEMGNVDEVLKFIEMHLKGAYGD